MTNNKFLSEDVFTVKYKDCATDKIFDVNPCINDPYFDNVYRINFRVGRFVLVSGELPDKWK